MSVMKFLNWIIGRSAPVTDEQAAFVEGHVTDADTDLYDPESPVSEDVKDAQEKIVEAATKRKPVAKKKVKPVSKKKVKKSG